MAYGEEKELSPKSISGLFSARWTERTIAELQEKLDQRDRENAQLRSKVEEKEREQRAQATEMSEYKNAQADQSAQIAELQKSFKALLAKKKP